MLLSQISGMALLIWESNDIAEDKSSSSYPKIRWPLDLICPSMFILLKMNQWCQRSMLFSDGKFSESISSGPTISSTPRRSFLLKAFVKGVRGYFLYYLRRFSLCFCLNNAFQSVLSSQTATMVKKHFDFIICFALLNHKNSIWFVFLRMVIWGG